MSYRPRKTDSTHAAIRKALSGVTVVVDVHELGKVGCDLIARHIRTGAPVFIEAKSNKKISHRSATKLTANETGMAVLFPDNWRRCETVDEAYRAVGLNFHSPSNADRR